MIRDKIIYMLTNHFGVSEEAAKKLKAAGIDNAPKMRTATVKQLKDAGLKQAEIDKVKGKK